MKACDAQRLLQIMDQIKLKQTTKGCTITGPNAFNLLTEKVFINTSIVPVLMLRHHFRDAHENDETMI